ncbi:MAG: OmpA family protein [Lentimicrobium sp.]
MKKVLILLPVFMFMATILVAQVQTVSSDKDWSSQQAELKNAYEAEFIIRTGDVDNLGFGWPENFDPFCGRMTDAHSYPWDINPDDLPGMDRILLSSKYYQESMPECGQDGYTGAYDPKTSKPVTYTVPTTLLKVVQVKNAWLQLFIDDFQAPSFCSRFQMFINGKRFAEGEKILNAIDQTGPVGKLISLPVPEEFYDNISSGKPFEFKIDEVTGAGDGFAIDFIRLLVNRIRENSCKGNIRGYVLDKETNTPISGARVHGAGNHTTTNQDGYFELRDLPTGFEVLTASAFTYADGSSGADIGEGDGNYDVIIYLQKGGESKKFDNKEINVGETVNLSNILFDQDKSELRPASQPELEKVVSFMLANPNAEIELSGHTSSEGNAGYNRSLSYRRVKTCKDYITSRGIDPGRIIAVGYGPDRPVAANDSEANRAKNRRVEMRIVKL